MIRIRYRLKDSSDKTADAIVHLPSLSIPSESYLEEVGQLVLAASNAALDLVKVERRFDLGVGEATDDHERVAVLYAGGYGAGTIFRYWYGAIASSYLVGPIMYREDIDQVLVDGLDAIAALVWPDESQQVVAIAREEGYGGG